AGLIRFAHATTPQAVGEVQPLVSPSSGSAMVFDGRLDNRADLCALLGASAPPLQSAPDIEIALRLFDRFGDDFVQHLTGDFAIAVWQLSRRRLALFRSPFGWRPLLWTFDGRTFGFASEPKALVIGLGLKRALNEGAIGEYLSAHFVTDTETFWDGIYRVPQGGAVACENGRTRQWAWHGGPFDDLSHLSMGDHVERFNELFDRALIATTRSSTAVTSQLSGGLDSSSVVCRSMELFRDGRITQPVGAISARFPGEPHDETDWSDAAARHAGITAEVAHSQPFDAQAARQWCADSYQLPLRPNVLDTMAGVCSKLASDGRRVLLTGEGGDDWLNGGFEHWPDLFMKMKWGPLFRHGAQQWPGSPMHVIARRTLYPAVMPLINSHYRQAMLRPQLDPRISKPDWICSDWAERIGLYDRWHSEIPRHGLKGFAQKSRYSVFALARRHVNIDAALAYSERQGIEIRHPFHDLGLTRFYMGMSGNHLRRHGLRKVLLREAMRGTLPEIIRTRTSKAVFVGHTVDAVNALFDERPPEDMLCAKLGWVDGKKIGALHAPFRQWREQGSQGDLPASPWGPVWFALATDMWLEHAFGI
ncbi:MAG: asparagine synthase-related protein, partial [Sphingopyxis sp.]